MSVFVPASLKVEAVSRFWRDPALPFIEARDVSDGRWISHALHAHESFSIGAVTAGQSTYLNGDLRCDIQAGTVVLMNPGAAHACNPLDDQPWAYHMLYVDTPWLAALQGRMGIGDGTHWVPLAPLLSSDRALFDGVVDLYACLVDAGCSHAEKERMAVEFFTVMLRTLAVVDDTMQDGSVRLQRVVDLIRARCTEALTLEQMSEVAGLSPSYLIRAFKQRYGMTPHAWLNDARLQHARRQLRDGVAIADAAQAAGFADQAHLQRLFKRSLATTPGHYRQGR
ncbi:MAG: AraC family transcriptional regulator [Janthinobacterium lividum]